MPDPITVEQIDAILPFLEVFDKPGFKPVAWGELGNYMLLVDEPWVEYSVDVNRFVEELSGNNWIVPFDWLKWYEESGKYVESPERLSSADPETIRKILTTHVRKNRVWKLHLAEMFKNGHIVALLRRLRDIRQQMNA